MMMKKWFVFFALLVSIRLAFAVTENPATGKPTTEIITKGEKGSEFQLEVRQMPLVQVLKELSTKTSIPIHYSVLPEGLITATCVGNSLKPVLECLLNRKADIIVRYSKGKITNTKNGQIAEAWVLGSKLEAVPNSALCIAEGKQGSMNFNVAEQGDNTDTKTKPNQSDYLLKIVQTGNPTERAEAIGNLLAIGAPNDPKVKAILEEAVHDQDENVRAQAISTLTHRDDYDENAKVIIQEALQDSSVDVRMMAVDGITDDVGLLQQAANDSDETISAYATQKLEELSKQQTKRQ